MVSPFSPLSGSQRSNRHQQRLSRQGLYPLSHLTTRPPPDNELWIAPSFLKLEGGRTVYTLWNWKVVCFPSSGEKQPRAPSSISAGPGWLQPCQDHFIGSSNIDLLSISRQHAPSTLSVPQFLQMCSKAHLISISESLLSQVRQNCQSFVIPASLSSHLKRFSLDLFVLFYM